jgi:hypothetical protein
MSEARPAVKLDFISGLENIPAKPRMDASTTLASVNAGRDLGFSARQEVPKLKVTAAEKEAILEEAHRHIQDPASPISNIGEFVVMAVAFYKSHRKT